MLTIKHKVNNSTIAGLGLFAEENIAEGTLVWKNFTDSELIISDLHYNQLSEYMKLTFTNFGYKDKITNEWKLPLDNSRFMNHSDNPNLKQDAFGNSIAAKNIHHGDEICCNYRDFVDEKDYLFL